MANEKKTEKCNKKINLLVYETPVGQKTENRCKAQSRIKHETYICHTNLKPIRVCTGAELKKMCPPKVCKCTPKHRLGLLGIIGIGLKSALAAGALYLTVKSGIWGTSDDTQDLYESACSFIKPQLTSPMDRLTKWDPPACEAEKELFTKSYSDPYGCDKPPFSGEHDMLYLKETWNKAISYIFCTITNLPGTFHDIKNYFMPENEWIEVEINCETQEGEKQEIQNDYK